MQELITIIVVVIIIVAIIAIIKLDYAKFIVVVVKLIVIDIVIIAVTNAIVILCFIEGVVTENPDLSALTLLQLLIENNNKLSICLKKYIILINKIEC